MHKPNILYLSTSLNIGGTELFLSTLVKHLRQDYNFTVAYIKEKGFWGDYLEKNGINVVHLPSAFSIYKYLSINRFDIIHTFLFRANILGRIIAKITKQPVIVSSQQAIDRWKWPYHTWIDAFSAKYCNTIIANSFAAKEVLIKRDGIPADKIIVVYNGIDIDSFKTKRAKRDIRLDLYIEDKTILIGCVMRLHKEKGADYLPKIALNTKKGIFIIIGDGPYSKQLKKRIKHLQIEDRFIFLGWQNDIHEILKACDVFLLPSREESFPQAILEAMAMKLPVVASNVGGVSELVIHNENGFLIKPGKVKDFASALNVLVSDRDKSSEMGESGYKRSLQFTEGKMVSEINSIYNKFLGA